MNTETASYTPLECLLLFQSIVAYGTDDTAFVRTADLLRNNALVKDGDTYDAGRLSAEALHHLYLHLLDDELKAEEEGQEEGSQSGSKKRKVPTPALPTIKDAEEHKEKLPILVDRLYARYRSYMVESIKEDERRYAVLQQEVSEIERGEWDDRILKESKALANQNGSASPQESRAKINGDAVGAPKAKAAEIPTPQPPREPQAKDASPLPPPLSEARPEVLGVNDVPNSRESTGPSSPQVTDSKPRAPTQDVSPPNQQRPTSNGPHGPSPLQTAPPQPGMAYKWEPPYGPPHQPPPYQHGAPYPPFNPQQFPPQPYPPPPRGSFPSPHGLQHPHPHIPSSPIAAQYPHQMVPPPPNGGHRSPGSPGMQLDALADAAGQQYRAPSGSPMMQGPPMQAPPPGGYSQPYPPQHLQQQRSPSAPGPPPQWNQQQYIPPYNGPLQQYPFQPAPPPTQRPFPPPPELVPPGNRQYNSPYNASQGPRPAMPQNISRSRPSLPSTPMSQGLPRFITGSGTRWTPNPTGSTPRAYTLVEPPAVEPLSPILPSAKPPSLKKSTKKDAQKTEAVKSKPLTKKRGAHRTRAGSTASSVIARSYRSQSIMSHADADELSLDHNVKEEVATPLPLPPGLEDELGDTTADESFPNPHTRPSNLASSPVRLKRKRKDSILETSREIDTPREPIGPATHVLWTRAFPKISASALESITGHRNASMFAAPLKERDAPGYKHLVLRPQDLKSIKSAILAGQRAASTAVPDDIPATQSSVWLPISEDLIPPKGIINYAQLEKELMRMFANAIMFNADPDRGLGATWEEMSGGGKKGGDGYEIDEDGVVKDTRAMFADVEKIVGSLRSAERRSEEMRMGSVARGSSMGVRGSSVVADAEDEVDELAGDGDVGTGNGTAPKRRRKA